LVPYLLQRHGVFAKKRLDTNVKGVTGVETVDFSLERKVAVVEFDPEQTQVDDLLRAVLKEGYHVS